MNLKHLLPIYCLLCGRLALNPKPFIADEIAGYECDDCECGSVRPAAYIPTSKRKIELYRNAFAALTKDKM